MDMVLKAPRRCAGSSLRSFVRTGACSIGWIMASERLQEKEAQLVLTCKDGKGNSVAFSSRARRSSTRPIGRRLRSRAKPKVSLLRSSAQAASRGSRPRSEKDFLLPSLVQGWALLAVVCATRIDSCVGRAPVLFMLVLTCNTGRQLRPPRPNVGPPKCSCRLPRIQRKPFQAASWTYTANGIAGLGNTVGRHTVIRVLRL